MPEAGLEPAQGCPYRILSPARLPFHHSGTRPFIDSQQLGGMQEGSVSSFLLDELADQPVDREGDLVIDRFGLVALLENLALGRGPLIAFAVTVEFRRDLSSPLLPRGMVEGRLEHLLEFRD